MLLQKVVVSLLTWKQQQKNSTDNLERSLIKFSYSNNCSKAILCPKYDIWLNDLEQLTQHLYVSYLELVSKVLNHLAAILQVCRGFDFYEVKKMLFFKKKMVKLLHF